jgi:hypothetical protein
LIATIYSLLSSLSLLPVVVIIEEFTEGKGAREERKGKLLMVDELYQKLGESFSLSWCLLKFSFLRCV